jgi:hypothetical protein
MKAKTTSKTGDLGLDLHDCLRQFPHGGNSKYIEASQELEIGKIDSPIGIALLPTNNNIVIGVTGKDEVHIYDQQGGCFIAHKDN